MHLNLLCSKVRYTRENDSMYMYDTGCLSYLKLKEFGFTFSLVFEEDLPKNNLIHLVEVVTCRNYPFYISNYLKSLEPEVLNALKNALVIFDFSKDPLNSQVLPNIEFIKGIFKYFEIPLSNILILVSDFTIKKIEDISVIPMDYWGYVTIRELLITKKEQIINADLDIEKRLKNRFLCLNRTIKDSRLLTVSYLHKNNLLDKGIYSLHNIKYTKPQHGKTMLSYKNITINPTTIEEEDFNKHAYSSAIDSYISHALKNYKQFFPKSIDDSIVYDSGNVTECISSKSIHKHFEESLFSILTETTIFGVGNFISEKTWLRILHRHPFIMISTPFHMRVLKNLGFKTFDFFIKEDYDNIKDNSSRLFEVWRESSRLINLSDNEWRNIYEELEDTLNYNYDLLVNNYKNLVFNKLFIQKVQHFFK